MNFPIEATTMEPAFQKAERLVKAYKAMRKRLTLESALVSRYRHDEFIGSTPISLGEVGRTIRGFVYQSFEVNLGVTGSVLDLVVTED